VLVAMVWAVIGAFLGLITGWRIAPDWSVPYIVWAGIVGAIAGSITRTDLGVTRIAVVGFVGAAMVFSLLDFLPSRYSSDEEQKEAVRAAIATWLGLPRATRCRLSWQRWPPGGGFVLMFGGPIWSAMIGVNIKKRKGWA